MVTPIAIGVPRRWLAQAITFAFSPPIVLLATSVLVVFHTVSEPLARVKWETVSALLGFVVPTAVAVVGVRRGTLSDIHIDRREQRVVPFMVSLIFAVAGLALLVAARAPVPIVAMIAALVACLVTSIAITTVWKVSNHCFAITGCAMVLALALGGAWLVGAALVLPVGWARIQAGSHTRGQALAGSALGLVIASAAYEAVARTM